MKIKELLEKEHSKKQTIKIIRYVGNDRLRFDELVAFALCSDKKLAQRASWPLLYCAQNNPAFVKKHLRKMIRQLNTPVHNAIKRNFMHIFEFADIPEFLQGEIISLGFELLNNKDEAIAVKVFSMSMLARFCMKYPDLKKELNASIQHQLPYQSAGFRSRARKVLNQINGFSGRRR